MAVQMFLIQPRDADDDAARETLATIITQRGGFILMATSHGSLIAAFDDAHLEAVKKHPLVEFASGVTLDPNGPGAAKLQRMFAENVAAQLRERGVNAAPRPAPAAAPAPAPAPPGAGLPWFRPIRRQP